MRLVKLIAPWMPVALLLCQGCAGTVGSGASGPGHSATGAAVANLNLGAAYLGQGQLGLALERLDRALEHDPRLAETHTMIATVYDQMGDVDEARRHHLRAIRLEPDNPATANSYGVFLCRRGSWSDAEPQFERAARNPRYRTPEVALTNAGVCARNAGEVEKAEHYLRVALARNPRHLEGLFNMAALAFSNQDAAAARHFLRRHHELAPQDPQAARLCVQVETRLGNKESARRCVAGLGRDVPESAVAAWPDVSDHGEPR